MKPRKSLRTVIRLALVGLMGLVDVAALADGEFTNKQLLPLNLPRLPRALTQINPEIESKIASYFENKRCDKILNVVYPEQLPQLRPIITAVVAYCQPSRSIAEGMFSDAETRDASNDLILVLHARYLWKIDPAASLPIWQKVLQISRKKTVKTMAQDYLEGTTTGEGEEEVAIGSRWHYFLNLQLGVSRESNPSAISFSSPDAKTNPSNAENLNFASSLQRVTSFGSSSLNYYLTRNRYPSQHEVDFLAQTLDAPVTFKADTNADVSFRPFASVSTLGNSAFQQEAGLGILGWMYRSDYNQSIEGDVFRDHYSTSSLQSQQGLHLRVQYNWEFYPGSWFLKFLLSFEHVTADQDSDPTVNQTITYSHNDIGLQAIMEYTYKFVTFGIYPRFLTRQDDNSSTYFGNDLTGEFITKRRQDNQLIIQPNLTFHITRNVQIFCWYEYNRIFSNIGPTDYTDRNVLNQTVGIALRTFTGNL